MTEEVEKKKKHTRPSSLIKKEGGKVMTPEEAGKSFVDKMMKQPEKVEKLMDKVLNTDIDDLLEKMTSGGDISKEDFDLVVKSVLTHDKQIEDINHRCTEIENEVSENAQDIERLRKDFDAFRYKVSQAVSLNG